MTIDTNGIIKLIVDVMGDHQVQVTASQSLKGAAITGACSFIGGILAGPVGLAVGGASGGAFAAFHTKGTFESISQIMIELSDERKQLMADEIQSIVDKLEINDLSELFKLVIIYKTLSRPQSPVIRQLIHQSLPVIQRHVLQYN